MATTTLIPPATLTHRRFTLEEYERLIEVGILDEDERVELIEGSIVEMSPIGVRHVYCVADSDEFLKQVVPADARVLVQSPIKLPGESEPQPDLVVVRRAASRRVLPEPPDVLFVVEISDSSLDHDRRVKMSLYAAAGIPESWIFDLGGIRTERYTDPRPDGYRQMVVAAAGEQIASTVLPMVSFDVDELLGPTEGAE